MRPMYFLPVIIPALLACGQANAQCTDLPQVVQDYLQSQPGWSLVDVKDLANDDKSLWESNHSGLCPGLAVVDIDGTGVNSYALALLRSASDGTSEKVVVVRNQSQHVTGDVLVQYENVSPLVVWRLGPSRIREWSSGRMVTIAHDAIVVEKLEATARVYYFTNGKFQSILTSN